MVQNNQPSPGGTKSIGKAIVQSFLAEGATVHYCSRTQSDLSTAHSSDRAHGSVVDVSQPDNVKSWVESSAAQSGKIDVVVANVSALVMGDDPADWHKAFGTDMMGTHSLVNAALPHLKKSKGSVVTISSVSGRIIDFTANPSPYGAMKAALIHYTSQLAHKYAPDGVRANTVSPGNIYVEDGVWGGIEKSMPEFFKKQMGENPLGRMGKAEEVADMVVFLASERAAFVTGSNVVVDGGLAQGVQF
jgi:3-oxoacyl-[acyl-carrier protein] reductase